MTDPHLDPEYVAARRVLLDALLALRTHGPAVVVAGAQAVYLRTGSADLSVAPFTTDGDLAIDARQLGAEPQLGEAMISAGFALHLEGGHVQPGVWERSTVVVDRPYLIPVDLIVPDAIADQQGRRGARLGVHGNQAARRAVGLEAALVDHDPILIEPLDSTDDRSITAEVAGVAALLIAKAHKLHDRVETGRPARVVDKDAADVFRLMQTADPIEVATTLQTLKASSIAGATTELGLRYLVELFRRPASTGIMMAASALRLGVPQDRIATVCNGFVDTLMGRT
jgi:hypothetical protein